MLKRFVSRITIHYIKHKAHNKVSALQFTSLYAARFCFPVHQHVEWSCNFFHLYEFDRVPRQWPLTHTYLWPFRDGKISYSERVKCGVTEEQLWLKINEPTDKDKGKYAIDIFAGEGSIRRVLDLTGQGKGLRCFKHSVAILLSQCDWTVSFGLEFIICLHLLQ